MTEYGLPSLRDKDGDLQPVDHTFDWGGEEVTIRLLPPTISQQEEYEELGEDADVEKLRSIVDEHLVKPKVADVEDLTARELFCYLEGIVDFSIGGGNDLAEEVRRELDERDGAPGN